MDQITQQIESLNTRVRRQQYAVVALFAVLAGIVVYFKIGDANATFDRVTCREWVVVDTDRKIRIGAGTSADGQVSIQWYDKDEKLRIAAGTVTSGQASVQWFDKDGKPRIAAGTVASGQAAVQWFDKDGKMRIDARTRADGTVVFPSATGE
jgi:hypothetical protein